MFLLKTVYRNARCLEFDELLAGLWDHFLASRCRSMEMVDSVSYVGVSAEKESLVRRQHPQMESVVDCEGDNRTAYF